MGIDRYGEHYPNNGNPYRKKIEDLDKRIYEKDSFRQALPLYDEIDSLELLAEGWDEAHKQ